MALKGELSRTEFVGGKNSSVLFLAKNDNMGVSELIKKRIKKLS